jgi:FAD/FMN-containing dehydrogenase
MSSSFHAYPSPDFDDLRGRIAGDVVLPADESWEEARRAWNLAADQRPVAVVLAENAEDVVEAMRFARDNGFRVAPQGTGHGATALGGLEDAVLVKTERMRGVEIDAENLRARAEAGAWWEDVVEPAAEHGLVALHGSSHNVGVVGYTLGGGMGWLARKHGLAANSVTAIDVVTADGVLRRASADENPDLFWALRGGGGSFGVVTAIEFRLYPLAEVYAGWLIWPQDRAAEVLKAWSEWTKSVPDEVTSVGRLLNLPPLPEIPEPLRGRQLVVVEAAFMGGEEEGRRLLAPLRALGPELDTFAQVPAKALSHLHQDPEGPVPGAGDGMLLRELPAEAVDALVETAAGTPLLSAEIRHTGGALAEAKPGNGVAAALAGEYAVFAVGMAISEEMAAAVEAAIDRTKEALAPWSARTTYFNFSERPVEGNAFYADVAYRRLRRVKTQYDPGERLLANHPIRPA